MTEKLVQQALERLMENRTVVAIAHRLSTIEHADKVVVLEEGEVVEQGPYDELLRDGASFGSTTVFSIKQLRTLSGI